jgi:uncharacterized membrane protein
MDNISIGDLAKKLLVAGTVFVCLDGVFLTLISKKFGEMIVKIQNGRPVVMNYTAGSLQFVIAAILYTTFIKPTDSFAKAGLLGMCVNGIYDTTNMALFKDYDKTLAIIDILWGFVLYGTAHKIITAITS